MTTEQPLVSVILCNYNYGQFIAEAIESVLNQTYTNFELIIVDDGSTDNSKEVINKYKDLRIQPVFQKNGGQSAAFNTGFKKVRGDLVAFLDSDDAWVSEKLIKVVQAFRNGDFSIVQHNLEWIDKDSRPLSKLWPGISASVRDVFQAYLSENHTGFFCTTSGIVCRRTDLQKIFPLNESWKICADVAFTRPLPLFGQVLTLKECLGYYRVHGSNTWMNSERQKQQIENSQKYVEYTNQWLAKMGYTERLDFTKSPTYKNWQIQQLPRYHPQRLWRKIVVSLKRYKGLLKSLTKGH